MDVSIENVENLFSFEFFLYYNTTVLTATGISSYDPFTLTIAPQINDTGGWAYAAYSMPFGTEEGFSTVDPAAIVKIDFSVDTNGTSLLDLEYVKLSEPIPILIPCDVVDGVFSNAYTSLWDDYNNLLADYNDLLDDYANLLADYNDLLANHTNLHGDYDSLCSGYDAMEANFNSLESNYTSLQSGYSSLNSTYNDLKSKNDALTADLGFARNIGYLFLVTTIIFVASTAYLAMRKPKVKPE